MPNSAKYRAGPDRLRINISDRYEVDYWSKKLNVTPEQLKYAVHAVGDRVEAVKTYLLNHPQR